MKTLVVFAIAVAVVLARPEPRPEPAPEPEPEPKADPEPFVEQSAVHVARDVFGNYDVAYSVRSDRNVAAVIAPAPILEIPEAHSVLHATHIDSPILKPAQFEIVEEKPIVRASHVSVIPEATLVKTAAVEVIPEKTVVKAVPVEILSEKTVVKTIPVEIVPEKTLLKTSQVELIPEKTVTLTKTRIESPVLGPSSIPVYRVSDPAYYDYYRQLIYY